MFDIVKLNTSQFFRVLDMRRGVGQHNRLIRMDTVGNVGLVRVDSSDFMFDFANVMKKAFLMLILYKRPKSI